jgi:class 3 adenylate cyclase
MSGDTASRDPTAVDATLAAAERKGFRLAVLGRTVALIPIGVIHPLGYQYPNNLFIAVAIIAAIAIGLIPLALIDSRYERVSRYALFGFDMAALGVILALAPISSGGDVPQNLVFLTSRGEYFLVVLAVSTLALSPSLVLWTGFCGVVALAAATIWIAAGMEHMTSFASLPVAPSREAFVGVVLSPDFLGVSVRINEGLSMAVVSGIVALAVGRARNVVRDHAIAEMERNKLRGLFGRFVPVQIVEQLISAGQLAPQIREASIVFADIEGFTGLSEALSPEQVVELLNCFFGEASRIVDSNGGTVINYIGDAIIASFNAPLPSLDYPTRAVRTARMLLDLVASREFEGHRLSLRVGIATGQVAAGNVGAAERQTYTLYGDTVNLSQRLEAMNKELGTSCLVCGNTSEAVDRNEAELVRVGSLQVRGRQQTVQVFKLPS